ncbi:hypothetical protein ABG067_002905 [Albugo candida]
MDSIFPRHRELLEVHHLKDGLNEEQQMRTENTMDLNKIKQFWTSSCSIHFLEYTGNAACQRDPLYIYFCLPIHKLELYRMDPQKCVRCSAGNYFVIAECNDSNVRYQKKIGLFHRYESIVNIETYPKPSDFEVLDERMNNCIVLYYVLDRRVRCHQCMKKAFSTKYDPHILTKTSSLVDTAKLSSVLPAWSLQNLLTCHLHDRCARLQKVPYHFCSEHASFLSSDSSKSTGRDATMRYTQKQVPVGIWPPQEYYALMSHAKLGRVPNLSPVHSNRIALVQFEYVRSTIEDCAKCLLEHPEVFFAYNAQSTSAGYVWMRPTSSNILRICVGKRCSSLSYDGDRKQVKRPASIRQLTKSDVRMSAKRDTKTP